MPSRTADPSRPASQARRPGRPPEADAVHGREALLGAARELMSERGFSRVTVREVAERAGVKPGLVNYHFDGKAELFAAIFQRVASEAKQRIQSVIHQEGTVEKRLRDFIREIVKAMQADPYLPRLMMEQVLFADEAAIEDFVRDFAGPNLGDLRALLREGVDSQEILDVEALFVIPAIMGCCIYFFLAAPLIRRLFELDSISDELTNAFADSTADLILKGLIPRSTTEELARGTS